MTGDESDYARSTGNAGDAAFDRRTDGRGRDPRSGRRATEPRRHPRWCQGPYHSIRAWNHGIPEEFQVLGYPDPSCVRSCGIPEPLSGKEDIDKGH